MPECSVPLDTRFKQGIFQTLRFLDFDFQDWKMDYNLCKECEEGKKEDCFCRCTIRLCRKKPLEISHYELQKIIKCFPVLPRFNRWLFNGMEMKDDRCMYYTEHVVNDLNNEKNTVKAKLATLFFNWKMKFKKQLDEEDHPLFLVDAIVRAAVMLFIIFGVIFLNKKISEEETDGDRWYKFETVFKTEGSETNDYSRLSGNREKHNVEDGFTGSRP